MKPVILFILITIPFFRAQSQVNFGFKGGANLNDIEPRVEILDQYGFSTGYHFGIVFEVDLLENLSLVPELQFTRKIINNEWITFTDLKTQLEYLELPLVLSYAPLEDSQLELGPSFAYKISAKHKPNGLTTEASKLFDKKFDLGLILGIKHYLTDYLFINVRAYMGLKKINEPESFLRFSASSFQKKSYTFYNDNFYFTIGFMF